MLYEDDEIDELGESINLMSDKLESTINQLRSTNIELEREYIDKNLFTEKLLHEFFKNYEEFLKQGFVMIKKYYIEKCNFLGREISVQVFNKKKTGIAKEINNFGELILENKNEEFILTMGDIL